MYPHLPGSKPVEWESTYPFITISIHIIIKCSQMQSISHALIWRIFKEILRIKTGYCYSYFPHQGKGAQKGYMICSKLRSYWMWCWTQNQVFWPQISVFFFSPQHHLFSRPINGLIQPFVVHTALCTHHTQQCTELERANIYVVLLSQSLL